MQLFSSIIAAVLAAMLAFATAQESFLSVGQVSKEYALSRLDIETRSEAKHDERLVNLENELRHTFVALPKNSEGHLEPAVVRYALHRLLMQRHGWFVKGLEPSRNGSASAEWVPEYLTQIMEQRTGTHGFGLPELAVLAATIEDMVHDEARRRLDVVYKIMELSNTSKVDREEAEYLIHMYLMIFLMGDEFSAASPEDALLMLGKFKRSYEGWREVEQWAHELGEQNLAAGGDLDYQASYDIAKSIGLKYGSFNDMECRELKNELLKIEDRKPGRVRLADFYKKGLHTHWSFTEKIDYLRTLGALDESDPNGPSVIVPNYLGSRPQCLEASNLYAVCCRNECEDLMDHIESEISEPSATADRISNVVANLSSDTITAPREISSQLLDRLREVSVLHGGEVPLHGRLFAQWMHHAFPRECPFPHEVGTTEPQTPDEWMAQTGAASTQASEDEMVCYVTGVCTGATNPTISDASSLESSPSALELPWSSAEELLVGYQTHSDHAGAASPSEERQEEANSWLSTLQALNRVLRTLVLAGAALGLAAISRTWLSSNSGDEISMGKIKFDGGRWVTLALFLLPLLIISTDFMYDFSSGNELLICVLCWGLLAAIVVQLVRNGQSPKDAFSTKSTCQVTGAAWV